MKFRVHKTSEYSSEEPPCEGAYLDVKGDEWERNKWAIEIDSLEALMKLTEIEGQVVVSRPCDYNDDFPEIEIYDTYRE